MLDIEHEAKADGFRFIFGVDEAGRGPLAGPVVAAAVLLHNTEFTCPVRDSAPSRPDPGGKGLRVFGQGIDRWQPVHQVAALQPADDRERRPPQPFDRQRQHRGEDYPRPDHGPLRPHFPPVRFQGPQRVSDRGAPRRNQGTWTVTDTPTELSFGLGVASAASFEHRRPRNDGYSYFLSINVNNE